MKERIQRWRLHSDVVLRLGTVSIVGLRHGRLLRDTVTGIRRLAVTPQFIGSQDVVS
jgi:hypothetical protein